jgi:hypothetical protein
MTVPGDAARMPGTAPDSELDGERGTGFGTELGTATAGSLVRPYTVTGGRTRPTHRLDMLTLVVSTGTAEASELNPDHAAALALCRSVVSVAEIAARMRLPLLVVKILISDLVVRGAVTTRTASTRDGSRDGFAAAPPDQALLRQVLHGLRERL